ncbi:MAG: hypothetical protein WAT23_15985 [Chromatiaceae bacterium]
MTIDNIEAIGYALERCFISPNVADSNFEAANLVDVIQRLSEQTCKIARAITPKDSMAGEDATGGRVISLTEAVMGVTAGLVRIANAIVYHSDASPNIDRLSSALEGIAGAISDYAEILRDK